MFNLTLINTSSILDTNRCGTYVFVSILYLAPTTDMAAVGNYNISAHASGAVTNIIEGSTTQITFGY
jgi:hypothetical protein